MLTVRPDKDIVSQFCSVIPVGHFLQKKSPRMINLTICGYEAYITEVSSSLTLVSLNDVINISFCNFYRSL
jgi:hypothetical protein